MILEQHQTGLLDTLGQMWTWVSVESQAVAVEIIGLEYTAPAQLLHWTAEPLLVHYTAPAQLLHYTAEENDT